MRLAYSGSDFKLRLRFRASHSGKGRAVDDPEMVYTGTAEELVRCMSTVATEYRQIKNLETDHEFR